MRREISALGWALAAILMLQATGTANRPPRSPHSKSSVFADLSAQELKTVHSFLWARKELRLQPSRASAIAKNSVFLIEMLLPKKHQVLKYLDNGQRRPVREARAIIFFGDQEHPNVTEFAVGPLPRPRYMRELPPRPGRRISWASRPMSSAEYAQISHALQEATKPLHQFFLDTTGFSFHDCHTRCLTFTDSAPRGLASGQRRTWFIFQLYVEGYFLHPTGLELCMDHGSTNPQDWTVEHVWYNGKFYRSPEELARKYRAGEVDAVVLGDPRPWGKGAERMEEPALFSSYRPRGDFSSPVTVHGPRLVQPQGPRYRLEGHAVLYGDWSFAFRLRPITGLQVLNLLFRGERVAYEVSVQEVLVLYGGHTPAGMQTKYLDGGWGLGTLSHELAPGLDCPETATFLDAVHHFDADDPILYPRALCLFEMPTGVPLRRHFNSNFSGGFNFYAGLEGQVLVLRTTSTVYNYDYIWDFIFYPSGVMEAKVHATGYVFATFYTPEGLRHGSRLHTHLLGNMHTHLVHYRVDLDVAGTKNGFQTLQMKLENITNPWSPTHRLVQPTLKQTKYPRERQAAFRFGRPLPSYLLFSSPQTNPWGHTRTYRLQIHSMAEQVLPPGWQEEMGITWARYPLAVTKYRESELCSSSLYNQNDPWDPPVVFEDFLRNNENIEDEDLVAWVTVGFLHIPHSEDIPNTATPGNSVGFLLRPFNFFPEDPSLASRDTVIVWPRDNGSNYVQRWIPEEDGDCLMPRPFSYNGTYGPV
ncbi:diamine oxidase [copper-containing] isoform X2 [Pteropus medius]|nr:amiloride-sensitive amine oxidase [copper-containing] isoform X2 [Pteropus giganteus]XP_039717165.1 amiloride-sensitive amine oxidase [copper-containing] isoform X2 [Pteropus giganteus]XP_039717166.1 amiloride-sensitive amine oxidase [copper-containing] isoform X2 [Pteropus giganteus]XP_039717167.1 amiloride-sensitive amine oxidase [copper-containing] isoform X2 [Pteropus giganteus]XP_039717168.1 amiloride-sensitive amine oxidase [copper-containing] isoform X2 [Pteropus giganteus]XP_0397171